MKNQRTVIVIVLLLLVSLLSIFCAASDNTPTSSVPGSISGIAEFVGIPVRDKGGRFFAASALSFGSQDGKFLVDRETRVVYLFYNPGLQGASGLTPLINSDGKPVLYDGE